MSQPVGDLVIDLSLDAVRFDEQMTRVRRHFSGLETDARKTATAVEQGLSRQRWLHKSRDVRRAV
ncbi:phage tail tape measure protein [Escherichia coli]|uniref:phage tail tape measure protein n=1 Tax=Escherichia coli TaxID=562 RepID=UPI0022388855|nr:phage tail tape measure protein [Escherichia coli]MCW7275382.1 phage tail tape measure protein [Escherichia coli]